MERPPKTPSGDGVALPDEAWRRQFRRRLAGWYRQHARDLPWRRSRDPYAIWVSEIMLQQTTVATVGPYFQRFLAAFPTIRALAEADSRQVLRLWEGLGYYRRATQLHEAAKILVQRHDGQFPDDPAAVRGLPGIGRYTAGAVLSIAFDARQPILEANTVRVFSRLLAYRGDPAAADGQRLLWSMAETVLPRRGSGTFNQALMELGSQVCLPREPRCGECPVADLCQACRQQLQGEIPRPKIKPQVEARHEAAVVIRRGRRVLLLECPAGGRWAGLWDFPRYQVHAETDEALLGELVEAVRKATGVRIRPGRRLATRKHTVTRFRITLDCFEARYLSGPAKPNGLPAMHWLEPSELEHYPLCTTGRELCRLLVGERS
jgi:A/G-specific adenine glycosylase